MSVRGDILLFKLLSHYELVVEHGQLKSAAEELGLKQSNLSKEMKLLEEMVGTELLTRTSHGVRLTMTGEHIYTQAKNCTNLIAEITASFGGENKNYSITLQATSATLMAFHKYLDLFKQIYPSVTCNFYDGIISTTNLPKNIDVCATYLQNKWQNIDIICEGKIVFALVTTKKYLNVYGYPRDLDDLHQNHHLCLCEEYSRYNPLYDDIMANCKHIDFQVSNFDMIYGTQKMSDWRNAVLYDTYFSRIDKNRSPRMAAENADSNYHIRRTQQNSIRAYNVQLYNRAVS